MGRCQASTRFLILDCLARDDNGKDYPRVKFYRVQWGDLLFEHKIIDAKMKELHIL